MKSLHSHLTMEHEVNDVKALTLKMTRTPDMCSSLEEGCADDGVAGEPPPPCPGKETPVHAKTSLLKTAETLQLGNLEQKQDVGQVSLRYSY